MKRVIQTGILFLLALFIFVSCEPGYVTVGARLDAPYYDRPVRPGPDYIWIDGDWYWEGGTYVYHHGYWSRPRGTHIWISGSWEQRNGGWYWRKGKWDNRRRH